MAYKIGLTGNIGCGKSAVGAMLRALGAEYVDADELVHGLLAAGSPIVERIADRFGREALSVDGGADRRRLGAIVFGDPAALRDLEAIVHPAVRQQIRRRLGESQAAVIAIDAIKLIESGLYQELDSVWVVTCRQADQRRRLTELRGLTAEEAEARIKAQPPQDDKLAYANVVIDNSGDLEDTRRQVDAEWERLRAATIAP